MPPSRELGVCFIIFEHLTSISSFEEDSGVPIILTPKVHVCSWLACMLFACEGSRLGMGN